MGLGSNLGLMWEFLRARKKWWLTPIVVFVLMMSLMLVLGTQSSAVQAFIYTIF